MEAQTMVPLAPRAGSRQFEYTRAWRLADERLVVAPADGAVSMVAFDLAAHGTGDAGERTAKAIATHLSTPAIARATVPAERFAFWCARSVAGDDGEVDPQLLPHTEAMVDRGLVAATLGHMAGRVGVAPNEPVLLEVAPARHWETGATTGFFILRITVRKHVAAVMCLKGAARTTTDPIPGAWEAV